MLPKMRRFVESVLKCCDINIKDILDIFINRKVEELNEKGSDTCVVGHRQTIKRDSSGTYLYCECGKEEPTAEIIKQIFGKKYLYCEKCKHLMKVRENKKEGGWFLGCSNYPSCNFTRSL